MLSRIRHFFNPVTAGSNWISRDGMVTLTVLAVVNGVVYYRFDKINGRAATATVYTVELWLLYEKYVRDDL